MLDPHGILQRIQQIQDDRETGVLTLAQDAKSVTVHFQDGLISAVGTDMPGYHLGQCLAKWGFIEESEASHLLEEARRRHMRLGETAVNRKLLDETELMDVVQEQAVQILTYALRNDFEIRSFSKDSLSFRMPARIDLNHLMLGLARKNLGSLEVEPNKLICLKNGSALSHLPWYPQELSVLTKLKYPRTLQELAVASGLEYSRLFKILSVFDALQLVAFAEEPLSEATAITRRESFPYESLIPEIRNSALSDKLELLHNASSFISEQFKTLKIRIGEISSGRPVRVITVSSPGPEEGKSLVCANLAVCFSKDTGHRTLIVDCDLRNPCLHKYFGISPEPGLKGFLENDYLAPYCYMRRLERLYIMASGGIADNPVELLSLEKMQRLIESTRKEFDTVILDSPPMAPISDAQILTSLSDGLVLVVRCGRTSYGGMERALKALDRNKLLGVVLNDVRPMMFNTHYDYKFYHYKYRGLYPYGKKAARPRPKTYLEE